MSEPTPDGETRRETDDGESDELVHHDDAVIARAFRWSLIALLVLAAVGAGAIYFARRPATVVEPRTEPLVAPRKSTGLSGGELPTVKFTDITSEAGITFVHNRGATGDKLLPETMGGGGAFFDFDGDGDADLLFVNSTNWPEHSPEGAQATTTALYQNDGKGAFTDVSAGSGLDVSFYGMGVACGDYDNDGRVDLFLSGVGSTRLFHNEGGGKFTDVTAAAGVGGEPDTWSTGCSWADYDNDGKLDLFVCHYVRWSREIDFKVGYTLVGVGRAYGPPMNFEGAFSRLYHNEGNGTFTDVSQAAGIQVANPATGVAAGKSLSVAPIDLDRDGWIDFVVANDTVQNFVFHNKGNGVFAEIGASSGVAFDSYGSTRGAMGIDVANFRNDASIGIAIGNFANEMTALYVSQGDPLTFTDEAIPAGVGPASRLALKFGVQFFDYDLDGWLDLLTANGHLEEEINKIQKSQQYAQPAQLFWNAAPAKRNGFIPVPPEKAGADLFQPIVGRGSAYADIDGDGDLDILLTQAGGRPLLLRNDQQLGHHWVRFKLIGKGANRDGLGAVVTIATSSGTQTRQVMPTRSYLSQSELPVTFGLGKDDAAGSGEITWPGGGKQPVGPVQIDAVNTIEQQEDATLRTQVAGSP